MTASDSYPFQKFGYEENGREKASFLRSNLLFDTDWTHLSLKNYNPFTIHIKWVLDQADLRQSHTPVESTMSLSSHGLPYCLGSGTNTEVGQHNMHALRSDI